jgi:hypothetical protein
MKEMHSKLFYPCRKEQVLPGLRSFIGFKQGFVEYSIPDRTMGEPKMNFMKLVGLGLDAIFSFKSSCKNLSLFRIDGRLTDHHYFYL